MVRWKKFYLGTNQMVKVSIIIPAYNVEQYIERCVNSALSQSLKDIEVIVVDDGSIDNTYNKCLQFNDRRLILVHQDNSGVASARNRGMEIASGEYIGFIDGDDYVDLNMFELLYSIAQKTDADIVNAKHFTVSDDDFSITKNKLNQGKDFRNFSSYVVHTGDELYSIIKKANENKTLWFAVKGIYRTRMLRDSLIVFPTNLDLGEETPFVLECMLCSRTIVSVNAQLYYYVQRNGSATKQRYRTGYFEKLDNLYQTKIKIYKKYNFKGYYHDLCRYTMCHTIPMILSNELVSGKSYYQQKQAFINMRNSEMISEAFENCSLELINSRLMYLAILLKYRLYTLLALICIVRQGD